MAITISSSSFQRAFGADFGQHPIITNKAAKAAEKAEKAAAKAEKAAAKAAKKAAKTVTALVVEAVVAQPTAASAPTTAPFSSFGRKAEAVEVLARSAAGLSEGGSNAAAEAVLGCKVELFDNLAKACRAANPQLSRKEVLAQVVGMSMTAVAVGEDLAESLRVMADGIVSSAPAPKDGEVTLTALREAAEAGGSAPAAEPVTAPVTDPVTLEKLAEKFGKPGNAKKAGGVRRHRQQ